MTPLEMREITQSRQPELVPELFFYAPPVDQTLEVFRDRNVHVLGAGVPYWAVAWPGGQAMARFLLDNPDLVRDRYVVDIGCGNGLAAVAAMRAGAAAALGIDIDPHALVATAENARLNGVEVGIELNSFEAVTAPQGAVICASDLWYEPVAGRRATTTLHTLAPSAELVLVADPGRPGRPRNGLRELASYAHTGSPEFERAEVNEVKVYSFSELDILPAHTPHAGKRHGIAG